MESASAEFAKIKCEVWMMEEIETEIATQCSHWRPDHGYEHAWTKINRAMCSACAEPHGCFKRYC